MLLSDDKTQLVRSKGHTILEVDNLHGKPYLDAVLLDSSDHTCALIFSEDASMMHLSSCSMVFTLYLYLLHYHPSHLRSALG